MSAITSVEWAAVARMASRHSPCAAGAAPQLTTRRSRPTDSSNDSVPAWAKRSTLGGAGMPQSSSSTLRPACIRWNPPSGSEAGARPERPAWASTASIKVAAIFPRSVEQRQSAIAVAQHPQGERHPFDRDRQRRRRLCLGRLQQRADLRQILQGGEQLRGAALAMAAVGEHLTRQLLRQDAQHAGEERGVLGQAPPPRRSDL